MSRYAYNLRHLYHWIHSLGIGVQVHNGLLQAAHAKSKPGGLRGGGRLVSVSAVVTLVRTFSLACDMKGRDPRHASRCSEQCITMNSRQGMHVMVSDHIFFIILHNRITYSHFSPIWSSYIFILLGTYLPNSKTDMLAGNQTKVHVEMIISCPFS